MIASAPGPNRLDCLQFVQTLLRQRVPPSDFDDAVQETMIRAWQHRDKYDESRGKIVTWIGAIARNVAADYGRKRRRRDRLAPSCELGEPAERIADHREAMPDEGLIEQERRSEVTAILASLKPAERELLTMAYLEGRTHSQLADHFGLPVGTVCSRLSNLKARIRLSVIG